MFSRTADAVSAVVQSYTDLAEGVYHLGRIDEAADLLARASGVALDLPDQHPCVPRLLNRLGVIRSRQGRHVEAERLLKRAVGIFDRAPETPGLDLSTALANLGMVYRAMGRGAQARAAYERALGIAEVSVGKSGLIVAWTLDQIGDLEASEGNVPSAVFTLRRSLAIKEKLLGAADWDLAVTLNRLAELYLKQERYGDAEAFLLRVVTIRERILGWGDPAMAKPLLRLGRLYVKQRKEGRAEQLVRYALKLLAEVLPPDHPEIIGCLNLLTEIYRGLSRYADADVLWELTQRLADGTERADKIKPFVLPTPPRMFGPGGPVLEPGQA